MATDDSGGSYSKIIPGSPGSAQQPRPNPPTFNPLQPAKPFGTKGLVGSTATGSSVSGLDTAMGAHADKLHPLKTV